MRYPELTQYVTPESLIPELLNYTARLANELDLRDAEQSNIVFAQVFNSAGVTDIWTGTQAEYDALTPDETTLYVIVG